MALTERFPYNRSAAPLVLLFFTLISSNKLSAQCADIFDVWNGVGVFTITGRVDSACTWEKTFGAYSTGDALLFNALTSNTYTFSVCGGAGGADTEINIYRAVTGFPNSGYADDGCGAPNGESSISWTPATSGNYYIVVSYKGCINTAQPITLRVRRTRVANDICETATVAGTGATAFNSANSCGYNAPSCETSNNDIWFTYTPTDGGMTSFSTCGASYDSHLSIWSACDGTELACNDDPLIGPCAGGTRAYLEYPVVAGTTYYVRISGFNSARGSGNLTITPPPPGSNPGEDCSNPFVGQACNQSYLNQTTIGLGNDQSTRSCGSGSYPGEDAYYAFSTSDGTANRLRVTLENVSDVNDATVEVILMSGNCNPPACTAIASFDIASGTFSQGTNFHDFTITPLGGAGSYFIVIDSRVDGIDAYDLKLECFRSNISPGTACSVDDTNSDGVVTLWNGAAPPPAVSQNQWYNVCHEVYVNGSGFEGLSRVRLQVSECLGSLTDFSPDGSDNGFYGLGNWEVDSVVDQTIYWQFYGGVSRCGAGLIDVAIDVTTDNWGSELYWELVPSGQPCGSPSAIFVGGNTANLDCGDGGLVITPSGGYPSNSTISEGFWCVSPGNYDIKYLDSYGDGGATFDVFINQQATLSFTASASADSATWTFAATEAAIPAGADRNNVSPGYSCNTYTFCYLARVLPEGDQCFFNDSIQDIITLFDNGNEIAGQSNVSSWFNRMGGDDATVLPIELLDLQARWNRDRVQVQWQTASELNTDYFVVERSTQGGQGWQEAGRRAAAGYSSSVREYQLDDLQAPPGTVYYRLRAVDNDGSDELHGPVFVRVPWAARDQLEIWPNPAFETAQVRFPAVPGQAYTWSLRSPEGKPLSSGSLQASRQDEVLSLDLRAVPAGVYFLQVEGFTPQALFRQ